MPSAGGAGAGSLADVAEAPVPAQTEIITTKRNAQTNAAFRRERQDSPSDCDGRGFIPKERERLAGAKSRRPCHKLAGERGQTFRSLLAKKSRHAPANCGLGKCRLQST